MLVEHSRSLEKSTKLAYSFNTFPIFSLAVIFATLIPYKLLPFDKVVVTLVLMLLDFLLFQCIGFHTKVTFLTPGRGFSNKVYKVVVTIVKILLKKLTTSDLCEIFRDGRKCHWASPQKFSEQYSMK